jgi:hypothetical protein
MERGLSPICGGCLFATLSSVLCDWNTINVPGKQFSQLCETPETDGNRSVRECPTDFASVLSAINVRFSRSAEMRIQIEDD